MSNPTALELEEKTTKPMTGPVLPNLEPEKGSNSRWWVWLLIFAALGYGSYRLYKVETVKKQTAAAKKQSMRHPHNMIVVAAGAHTGNLPVVLQGLGSVTPFNTVTVKSRVDGLMLSVNFREGQDVQKGAVLAEIDPRPFQVMLDQAKGTLAKDQAAARDAQVNLERDQELYREKIIAKQQLDTQAAALGQQRGSIAADEAAIASAQLQLSFTKIVAPISGRIGLRQVDAGNIVHAADATGIATIAQVAPISVLFNIPEDQLPPILAKLRANAKLPADAYDRNLTKKLASGTLLTVDNQIDQTTGTSRLKAIFSNADHSLFPNQFVNVKLLLDTKRNVVIVPAVAIQRGPSETYVYLIKPDKTVAIQDVKLGSADGNNMEITEGLKTGDLMVVDGADKLTAGMKVDYRFDKASQTQAQAQQDASE